MRGLTSFDGIIGDDTLREIGAIINRKRNILRIDPDIEIALQMKQSTEVNSIVRYEPRLQEIIAKYPNLFTELSDSELVDSSIKGEIRTTTDEAIYSKTYPYPACMRKEVQKQISELLENGIIRRSKSPYNSPVWVVAKKPTADGKKQYTLVIDYKRLNAVTVPDKYPIPDINATLANLGPQKYFTTVDLKS